ncbi:hypothetical protein, partial [Syntrophothermus sp.]|uniref:hypothetical protein n=1 Tax=Syntrophothermus sp. TaxID=2736299 RepID=UPI00257A3CD2
EHVKPAASGTINPFICSFETSYLILLYIRFSWKCNPIKGFEKGLFPGWRDHLLKPVATLTVGTFPSVTK